MNLSTGGLGTTPLFSDYFSQEGKKTNKHHQKKEITVTALSMETSQSTYSLATQLRGKIQIPEN